MPIDAEVASAAGTLACFQTEDEEGMLFLNSCGSGRSACRSLGLQAFAHRFDPLWRFVWRNVSYVRDAHTMRTANMQLAGCRPRTNGVAI